MPADPTTRRFSASVMPAKAGIQRLLQPVTPKPLDS